MKIKWGALVVDGRGKIGGQIASKNASGAYMKNKVTPSNPQTTFQTAVRALFGVISQAWSGLTADQISNWNSAVSDWAKTDVFGDLKKPTGKALFQRLNNQAQVVGLPALVNVPAKIELPNAPITGVSISVGGASLTPAGVYNQADAQVVIFGTTQVSNGTTNVKNKLRQLYFTAGDVFSATDAYAAYVAKFGAPDVGDNVFIGVKYVVSSGQASPLQVLKATVVA